MENEKINQGGFENPNIQYGWTRQERLITDDSLCRLTIHFSFEQGQRMLEAAEKAKFSVFGKLHFPTNGKDCFMSLTPSEVTAVRNNYPHQTNVIFRFFYCGVTELWVDKIQADDFLKSAETVNKNPHSESSAFNSRLPVSKKNKKDKILQEARKLAQQEGEKKWKMGIRQVTARNICGAVAKSLAKNAEYHGCRGEYGAETVRKQFLKGWKFQPPQDEN